VYVDGGPSYSLCYGESCAREIHSHRYYRLLSFLKLNFQLEGAALFLFFTLAIAQSSVFSSGLSI